MPVAELLARTSSAELTEWMAYERVAGPLGGARHDMLTGIVAATVANTVRGRRARRNRPADFIPRWDRGHRMDWEEMLAAVRGINRALGGTDTTTTGGGGGGGDAGRTPGRARGGRRRAAERGDRGG